jgi:hypothetical protein
VKSASVTWVAALAASVVIVVLVAIRIGSGGQASAPPPPSGPAGPPVADISQMTPREAADRLFDRIVRAAEAGDTAQVVRFQPMALSAYSMLEQDGDTRYHVGLIHSLTGNDDAARAQLDSLRATSPDHLLATMLEFSLAQLAGDEAGRRRAYRTFLDAYDAEFATQQPEYLAHQEAIDAFRAAAQSELGVRN